MQYRIYYEDVDCGGIVYHSRYLNFCERARSELFFQKNQMPFDQKGGFVVHSLKARYFSSLQLGDLIEVKTTLKEQGKTSLLLDQEIFHIGDTKQQFHAKKVFTMEVQLAFIHPQTHKSLKIPQEFLEVLK